MKKNGWKKIIFFVPFLFLTGCVSQPAYHLTTAASTVLYAGVDNPFEFTGKNAEKIKLSSEKGAIKKIDSLRKDTVVFVLRISEIGRTKITIKSPGKTVEETYRIKKIPDPVISFSGQSINEIAIGAEEAKKIKFLRCTLNGFDYNCAMSIQSFRIIIISPGGKRTDSDCTGAAISPYAFQKLEAGSILMIRDVVVKINGVEETLKVQGPSVEIK